MAWTLEHDEQMLQNTLASLRAAKSTAPRDELLEGDGDSVPLLQDDATEHT
jgi:hypothetical protein